MQLLEQAAERGARKALSAVMHLDNGITDITEDADIAGMFSREESDMPICRQRVLIGYDDDGKGSYKRIQAQKTDDLNDRIVQAYVDSGRISEFVNQPYAPKSKTPFREYAEKWMTVYKTKTLKPRTLQTYKGYLRTHIYPFFGGMNIEDIKIEDVQVFLNERSEQAKKSLKNYLALLAQILEAAVEDGIIEKSPTESKRLKIPSDKANPREALSEADFRDVIAGLHRMEDSREKLMLALLLFTGMRRGEALGLMWDDIDLTENIIHIRRNVTHPNNAPVIGTPKTKNGFRDVPMGEYLSELLQRNKATGYVFGGDKPLSLKAYNTIEKHIKQQIDMHGATAHVLRHTFLSEATAAGIDMKTIQIIAGHADITTTMNIYTHSRKESIQKAGVMMDNLLNSYTTNL